MKGSPRRPASPSIERRALVLSGVDSKDDRIVRLLCDDDTLVPAIARGARRVGKKGSLGAHIQPLSRITVELVPADEGHDLAVLRSALTEEPYAVIKGDLARTALAWAMAEVVLHLVPEHAREDGLFALLERALTHLETPSTVPREEHFLLFLLRMLDGQGILPPLDELPEVSSSARATLTAWREGRFARLEDGDKAHTARFLERALTALTGRPLASRSLLDAAF